MISILKGAGVWDYLAFAGVAFLVIRGFVRGCSGEMGRLVGTVTAAAVGYFGFRPIANLVLASPVFGANPYAGRLVTFILMAVLCIAIWFGLSYLLTELIRLAVAQPFDGILGGIIGGIKALVVVAAFVALGLLNPKEEERVRLTEQSLTARWLAPLLKNITGSDG
jgi:uncharacterized membrane protein required for colicin V production